jgi:hypothetical protein
LATEGWQALLKWRFEGFRQQGDEELELGNGKRLDAGAHDVGCVVELSNSQIVGAVQVQP